MNGVIIVAAGSGSRMNMGINKQFIKLKDKEIIVYTEEDHLNRASDNIKNMYEEIKNKILELDDIDIEAKKLYIAFKGKRNITDIEVHKNFLKIYINMKKGVEETKKFVTETGDVTVSENVIASIVKNVVVEIEGVHKISGDEPTGNKFLDLILLFLYIFYNF